MKIIIPQHLIDDGYISVNKHPELDLFIYNYTPKTQFDKKWTKYTLMCRGLILDGEGNIVARPFKKFFNIEEVSKSSIPKKSSFEVTMKMDGSLGILYWSNGLPYISTRGSFISDQSKKATEILYSKYSHLFNTLNKNVTYLFEILYKENRIVVDYGNLEDLILIATIDNKTGKDLSIIDTGFTPVKRYYDINDLTILKSMENDTDEGFVVKFKNGFRIKVKFDEYKRLHRILTNVSTRNIWEYLKEGKGLNEIIDRVPDEFYEWVKGVEEGLTNALI